REAEEEERGGWRRRRWRRRRRFRRRLLVNTSCNRIRGRLREGPPFSLRPHATGHGYQPPNIAQHMAVVGWGSPRLVRCCRGNRDGHRRLLQRALANGGSACTKEGTMKTVGLREAWDALSECVDAAQNESVLIMRHGTPAAVIVGVEGAEMDE